MAALQHVLFVFAVPADLVAIVALYARPWRWEDRYVLVGDNAHGGGSAKGGRWSRSGTSLDDGRVYCLTKGRPSSARERAKVLEQARANQLLAHAHLCQTVDHFETDTELTGVPR